MFRSFLLLLLLVPRLAAQPTPLETYVGQGLQNNLALKQKEISLEQSLWALREARGMFLPSVEIAARYSRAGGGRTIEFPVGDLMNPVYATLNEMLGFAGRPPAFPTQLENVAIPFLREEEQETKLRIVQPIFQPAIYYNLKMKSSLKAVREMELDLYRRQLVADIQTAYFNYHKTVQVVDLYTRTRQLLLENLRVGEKLFQHQKVTEEVVFQAQTELAELARQQAGAEKNQQMARAYLNFLVNQPLEQSVPDALPIECDSIQVLDLSELTAMAIRQRQEFRLLQHAIRATGYQQKLAGAAYFPNLTGVIDYGIQGEKYRLTADADYWMASAVLNWNLFQGGQDRARQQQAVLEQTRLETQLRELTQQIELEVLNAVNDRMVAQKSIAAAQTQLRTAQKTFEIIRKKFEQEMAPHIEFLNARTTLTNAEMALIIAQYDFQIKNIELRRTLNQSPLTRGNGE